MFDYVSAYAQLKGFTYFGPIGLMSRVFANSPGDRDSIPGPVIPKAQKIVLDVVLLNAQHYKD